jgi:hypothetical protein
MQRLRLFAAVIVSLASMILATASSGFAGVQVQYFGTGTANWNYDYSSGWNVFVWNRVWRATPDANGHYHTFALFYNSTSQTGLGYTTNRFDNPFWYQAGYGYTTAHCADVDPYTQEVVLNVTCQAHT